MGLVYWNNNREYEAVEYHDVILIDAVGLGPFYVVDKKDFGINFAKSSMDVIRSPVSIKDLPQQAVLALKTVLGAEKFDEVYGKFLR